MCFGKFTCWIFGFHVVVHKPNIVVVRTPNMCWSSGFSDEINANVFVDLFLFSQKTFHSANVFRGREYVMEIGFYAALLHA